MQHRVAVEGARQPDPLLLPAREPRAAGRDRGVVALRQVEDHLVRAGLLRRRHHLRRVGRRPACGRCSRRWCRRRAPRPAAGSRCSCRARPGRSGESAAPSSRTAPAAGGQMPVSARASVDLPAAEGPITPSAWPGFSRKSSSRRLAFCCSGGTTVSWFTSMYARAGGAGRSASACSGVLASSVLRLRPALAARAAPSASRRSPARPARAPGRAGSSRRSSRRRSSRRWSTT